MPSESCYRTLKLLVVSMYIVMSKKITPRLSEEFVEFIDDLVANGETRCRAAVVSRALNHEQRRITVIKDVAILARLNGSDELPDLAVLASHMAWTSIDVSYSPCRFGQD